VSVIDHEVSTGLVDGDDARQDIVVSPGSRRRADVIPPSGAAAFSFEVAM